MSVALSLNVFLQKQHDVINCSQTYIAFKFTLDAEPTSQDTIQMIKKTKSEITKELEESIANGGRN